MPVDSQIVRIILEIDFDIVRRLIISSDPNAPHTAAPADPIRILLAREQVVEVIHIDRKGNACVD